MANIKFTYAATTLLSLTIVANSVSASNTFVNLKYAAAPATSISFTTELIPTRSLANQTVTMSDATPVLEIDRVSGDTLTITDTPVLAVDIVKTDSVSVTDTPNKIINSSIDFDLSDPDVDPDPVTVADVPVLSPSVSKTDSVTTQDTPVKQPNKITTDSVAMAQAIGPFNIGKNPSDTLTIVESDSKTVTTARTDSAAITDSPAKTVTPAGKTDAVTVADTPVKQPNKITTDSVTAAESIGPFNIGRNPSDSINVSDSPAKTVTAIRADSASITDSPAKTIAAAKTDSITSSDAPAKNITPAGKTDSVTMAESFGPFTIGLNTTDTVSIIESLSTQLILGETERLYPNNINIFDSDVNVSSIRGYHRGLSEDAGTFKFTGYQYRVADFTGLVGGADSLINNTVIFEPTQDLGEAIDERTGVIGTAGLIGQPIMNADKITFGAGLTNTGLLVNFIYTDTSDSPTTGSHGINGHFLNETPMGAGSH